MIKKLLRSMIWIGGRHNAGWWKVETDWRHHTNFDGPFPTPCQDHNRTLDYCTSSGCLWWTQRVGCKVECKFVWTQYQTLGPAPAHPPKIYDVCSQMVDVVSAMIRHWTRKFPHQYWSWHLMSEVLQQYIIKVWSDTLIEYESTVIYWTIYGYGSKIIYTAYHI
jgi:hypothetical protein